MSSIDEGYAKYVAMQEELGDDERTDDPKAMRTGRFELHVPGKVRVPLIEERIRGIAPVFEVRTAEFMDADADLRWKTVYTWDSVDPAYDGPAAGSLRLRRRV